MDDLREVLKHQCMSLMRKLQQNTMAGCGFQEKKVKKSETRILKAALLETFKMW